MTRGYVFTLVDPTLSYNLWRDLIFPTLDPTMTNSPYTPMLVCDLQIYFPVAGPNSANNAGANVSVLDAISGLEVKNLISDATFQKGSWNNIINLQSFKLKGSAANVQVAVTISSI